MFSADELLNDGASLVTYYGFDPYGNKYSRQPSFNDFFTKKNADGEYERAIGAFRPIYAAGYIQDRFFLKDIVFDIGLRVDRYDANQKVLKDPYSLYDTYSAGEVSAINGREVVHPDGIGSNYKVYVNSLTSDNPTIVGYRDGDQWFDQYGNKLATGASLARGGVISPYLKNPNDNIKSDDFDPNSSFTDYKPQIVVMPRLQFQFDITDKAQFFAHYDVLAQRPPLRGIMDPTEYFFFQDNIGGTINNPNLKPQRTIDFQLGFKQRVSNTSALTISAFYREFRNMVQLRKIFFAYPKDYITYDNIDFGTTKGISLDFDLRRTGNISMSANYTLQFADGTGSSDRSQLNLVTNAGNAGITNLRAINPLNFDARHQFNVRFNYSYGSGEDYKGPVVGNKQILANTGLDIIFRARSGTPYTEQEFATPEGLNGTPGRPITKGTINGARLPWNFRLDLRLYRDFDFKVGKAEKEDDRRTFSLQVYLMLQNILNTQNPINVYRFTGNPNDDGYIFDPSAASAIQNAVSPQAFKDQYMARINSPANYSQPRTIRLGVLFNFY
jgi:outer membrane receptor protein involved in Fe transport